MRDSIEISFPGPTTTSSIHIKGVSGDIDGIIKFYSPLAAVLFHEAIECWNHQLYFGCIALAAESVAKAMSVEITGGMGVTKRKNIMPKSNKFHAKVNALVDEYQQLTPLKNDLLKLHNHYRNTWFHGIEKRLRYSDGLPPNMKNIGVKKAIVDSGQHKTPIGFTKWESAILNH